MARPAPSPLFTVDGMQFFGRELGDYLAMFALDAEQLPGARVLDCPSGPGAFVAESTALSARTVGVDPLYAEPLETLLARGRRDIHHTIDRMRAKAAAFADIDLVAYEASKLRALDRFARDFPAGLAAGRYLAASLPALPFPDRHFDVVLSAHLLFTYSDPAHGGILPDSPFSLDWHLRAAEELWRLSRGELRLYPTTTRWETPERHPWAEAVRTRLESLGGRVRWQASSFARGNHASDTLNACLVVNR
jgi:hypothetical protein